MGQKEKEKSVVGDEFTNTPSPEQSGTQPDTKAEEKAQSTGENTGANTEVKKVAHPTQFTDLEARAKGVKDEIEGNFDKYYNAARQKAKEYEELALMVKRVFGLNPYIPEESRIQTMLYRLGAPELLEGAQWTR